ncbi:MAG TPA: class I SAM-dependent methyltransferase [Candidatus Methanoperedens sp.]|nr:class I SAM-dependent methyltransferase [Candidatus Methanoperedens sp.]
MPERKTREPQYEVLLEGFRSHGLHRMGLMASHLWRSDPKHLLFLLARYKFCAKMLAGKDRVLEAGCGDGFGLPVLLQTVRSVHAVDFDPILVENAREINAERTGLTFETVDLTEAAPAGTFDAAYSLDVIEHIPREKEQAFLGHVLGALVDGGVLLIGTPNVHASVHASKWSNEGHVNLKDDRGLRALLEPRFRDVFVFSMNDEVVHTGFSPMAHYLFALAAGKRPDAG